MAVLTFSPEVIFVKVLKNIVDIYKEKYAEKAKIKVRIKDSKRVSKK